MNDFTKDELDILLNGLLWCDATILPVYRPEKLKSKLQSMIESYCEHEWEVYRKGSIVLGIYCEKCSKKLKGYI